MARVLVTRKLPGDAVDRLAAVHDVDLWAGPGAPPRETLLDKVAQTEGLLSMLVDKIDAELLQAAPDLKAVANCAVGYDNVDLDACRRRGIAVGNTPDVLTEATADVAFALILAAARRLPEGMAAVRDGHWGDWEPDWLLGLELHGSTLGIVGYGRIGQATARRGEGFGMNVIHTKEKTLTEVLEQADVVSVHVPLNAETRNLIDAQALSRMKPTGILVNTARGPIVDQTALAAALRDGTIAAAALDVTDPEPLPPDDPLLQAPNLIVLPHLGSATHKTRARMADLAVDNLLAALDGRPMPNPVP
jgi:glyoxylate reductase